MEREAVIQIRSRYAEVRERIDRAARRAGRNASEIAVVAVTKTFGADVVRTAWEAGIREFGENKAQEMIAKQADLSDLLIRWHFIGHLQTNKAAKVLQVASMIHSVDSLRLAQRLNDLATAAGRTIDILLQANTSGEESKFGAACGEIPAIARSILAMPHLRICGLMTLGPWTEDEAATRASFALLRRTLDELRAVVPYAGILSMGMSGDYEIAIEEGATHLRLGTVLFGARS